MQQRYQTRKSNKTMSKSVWMLIYGQETTSKGRKCEKLAFVQVNYNHSISELCTTEVNLAMNPLDFRVKKI